MLYVNKDLGFSTLFQKCICSFYRVNMAPNEGTKNNPNINAHFFSYNMADIFLVNQSKNNF